MSLPLAIIGMHDELARPALFGRMPGGRQLPEFRKAAAGSLAGSVHPPVGVCVVYGLFGVTLQQDSIYSSHV